MKLIAYLYIKVSPRAKLIPLAEKYPSSIFVFEYHDGESSRVDSYGDTVPKGKNTLRQNLSGSDNPSEYETIDLFSENLLNNSDLGRIQAKDKNVKRAWVIKI